MATDASRGESSAGGGTVCHPPAAGRAREGRTGPAIARTSAGSWSVRPCHMCQALRVAPAHSELTVQVVDQHGCHSPCGVHFARTCKTDGSLFEGGRKK